MSFTNVLTLPLIHGIERVTDSLVGRMGGKASAGCGQDAEHQHKLAPLRQPAALGDRRARPTRKPTFDMSVFSAKPDPPFTLRPNPFAAHFEVRNAGRGSLGVGKGRKR
jgi:hypothetical protein